MAEAVVRLASLTLNCIKNVKSGTITMPMAKTTNTRPKNSEILGIYGQNGSGKTAIVDALYYLQGIMIGETIDSTIADYIDKDVTDASIDAEFNIFGDDAVYEVGYHVTFSKANGKDVCITSERLACSIHRDGTKTSKKVFMDYRRSDEEIIFRPTKRLDELIGKSKKNRLELMVAKKIAEKSNCSYIFGETSREIFLTNTTEEFHDYSEIIGKLFWFALKDLFVIRNTHSGVISAKFLLPMAFRVEKEAKGFKGDFSVPLGDVKVLDKEQKSLLDNIIGLINMVLYTIIPGMRIEVRVYGKQALDSGQDGWRVELMSVRDGKSPIPIRMESEGIIKIVSILNALIHAFGNSSICLVIDELDAGIFEYMLGEILDIFAKHAKGQLLFTSHNLRALEMLPKESIMFSTANANHRYIHMKRVNGTNNFRSMYIRSITLGGQDEVIYEETDSLKIAKAFRKAGRSLRHV